MQIIKHLRRQLLSPKTQERFRQQASDFTRERVLTFVRVVILILRGHKFSLQNALNKFFSALGAVGSTPTASAYCQARQKLKPEVFVHLNQITSDDFYRLSGQDGQVKTWRGHRLLGADGTFLNLPDTPELRAAFTVQRNRFGAETVQALAAVLYDLRNDLGLAAALSPIVGEKKLLFDWLWQRTRKGDVLVLDRALADYSVIAWAVADQRQVIIRCPRQSFAAVNACWDSELTEQIVTLTVPTTPTTRQFVRDHHLPEQLQVRLLKFTLESGETEVLLTTLCDRRRYPSAEFKQVYGWRWGQETYYDRVKNIFEVERFSGHTKTAIEQDFFGVIFLATLESVLTGQAQTELADQSRERGRRTTAQVNRAVSYTALVDSVVHLLADPRSSPEEVLSQLHHLFRTNPLSQRPGRKFHRPQLTPSRKLRFHRYVKRIIA